MDGSQRVVGCRIGVYGRAASPPVDRGGVGCALCDKIVEIHAPVLQLRDQRLRQRVCIDFQTNGESSRGAYARTNAAEIRTFNRAMQLQRIAPEDLIAECIETKSLLALVEHALRVRIRLPLSIRGLATIERVCTAVPYA